jgi:hypothetical protein
VIDRTETTVTSETGGQKGSKLAQARSLPAATLLQLMEHYGKGAQKYSDHNFRKGYAWSLSYDALMRHLLLFWGGEDIDAETGSKHMIAVAWHALTLATFMDEHPEFDDRYRPPTQTNPVAVEDTLTRDPVLRDAYEKALAQLLPPTPALGRDYFERLVRDGCDKFRAEVPAPAPRRDFPHTSPLCQPTPDPSCEPDADGCNYRATPLRAEAPAPERPKTRLADVPPAIGPGDYDPF